MKMNVPAMCKKSSIHHTCAPSGMCVCLIVQLLSMCSCSGHGWVGPYTVKAEVDTDPSTWVFGEFPQNYFRVTDTPLTNW